MVSHITVVAQRYSHSYHYHLDTKEGLKSTGIKPQRKIFRNRLGACDVYLDVISRIFVGLHVLIESKRH